MQRNSQLLEHLSWPEIRAAIEADLTVIVPVGAIEQHGPHLPIDTDAYLAATLAAAGAEGRRAVVAPVIAFGCRSRPQSGGGELFPGTLSLAGSTFIDLVRDVLDGLLRHGFRKVLVFSWHMENQGFVYEAASQAASSQPHAKLVVMEEPFDSLSDETMARLFPDGFPGWPLEHAGILETSLMHYLRPWVVGEATDGDRLVTRPYDVLPERPPGPGQTGVLWSASGSSAESGELALREIVRKLQAVLDAEFGTL